MDSVASRRNGSSGDAVVKPAGFVSHTHDHDDAFDLFGTGPSPPPVVDAGPSLTDGVATPPKVLEVESPTAFTLFPQAAPLKDMDVYKPNSVSSAATAIATATADAVPLGPVPVPVGPVEVYKHSSMSSGAETQAEDDDFVLFPSALPDVPTSYETDEAIARALAPSSYPNDEAYAQALNMRLNGVSLSPPPPQFKNSGNSVDIIAARSTDNQVFTTSWHVMFGWSRFRSNVYTGVGDTVRVLVNGKELPTKMVLQERGRCTFTTGGLMPPKTDFADMELFEDRPNLVRFEHFQKPSDTIRYVESRLHLWGPNESVVVADLDGTLTISDVEGHIRTLRLGQYDFLHTGACDFYMKLHELDMRILYLTARPIDWASASRTHLENAKQHAHALPPGPLVTNSNGLTGALLTEVVNKNPHVFKAQVLNEIQLTLIHAGRVVEHPVFVAGFGNRPTDSVAYEQVGISQDLIFLIDPYSNLKAITNPRIFESYADPNAMLWLLPKLKHKVPIEKVQRIDDYTVRELVLAEDREQLLIAEREARRLQEEEYERAARRSSGNIPSLNPTTTLRSSMYGGSFNA